MSAAMRSHIVLAFSIALLGACDDSAPSHGAPGEHDANTTAGASGSHPAAAGSIVGVAGSTGGAGVPAAIGNSGASGASGGASAIDAGGANSQDAGAGHGGATSTGGSGGSGGASDDGGTRDAGNVIGDAVPSAGCGKDPTLMNSPGTVIAYNTITSSGMSRRYILRYPQSYDKNHPYRLVLAYHWLTGSAAQVFDCTQESIRCYTTQSPFYGLWELADDSTIFIAPDGLNAGWANSKGQDLVFTDDILDQVEGDLCIDTSRVFANGFSFGGGMSKALGCARADVFRAIAVYSGADFLSGCEDGTSPIAFYGSHGLGDPTNPYSSGKAIRDRFVANNGCTPQDPPEPAQGSGMHVCTSYSGCSSGHPTRWCAFDGVHDPSPKDSRSMSSWNPKEVWAFFTQF